MSPVCSIGQWLMRTTRIPFLGIELFIHNLELLLWWIAQQYLWFIGNNSPYSSSPFMPIHMLLQFSCIKCTDYAIKTTWVESILVIKGQVADSSFMRSFIFGYKIALCIHVNGIYFISTHKHFFLDRWNSASPDCVLMFAVYFFL